MVDLVTPQSITKYKQPQHNIQQYLKNKIINESKNFIGGESLLNLNNIIIEVLDKYEIILDEEERKQNFNITNEDLLTKFLDAKQIEGCSLQTIKYYKRENESFFNFTRKSVLNIKIDDVKDYLSFTKELTKCNNVTLDNKRRILNTTFQWFYDEGYIAKNPLLNIKKIRSRKKVKKPFSPTEVELLRKAAYNPELNQSSVRLRNRAMFELMLSSGIRVNELTLLDRNDINLEECSMIVHGKGNKQREVYFSIRTQLLLQEYLKTRDDNYPCLFKSMR